MVKMYAVTKPDEKPYRLHSSVDSAIRDYIEHWHITSSLAQLAKDNVISVSEAKRWAWEHLKKANGVKLQIYKVTK